MNLQTHIRHDLWKAVSSTYESKHYSDAILDAMHHLSELLREKSGVEGDGAQLVGQALGGDPPKLRINRLQSPSEKDQQKGLEQLLRGMYLSIRNPRSHEQIEDTQATADAIIYFINYVLDILSQSEEPFTLSKFLGRVFDADFFESKRYAELLAAEIPENKRLDVVIEIFRRRGEGNSIKLAYTVHAIVALLTKEQVTQYLAVVSDELKNPIPDEAMASALQLNPFELWTQVDEAARLKAENKLLQVIELGEVKANGWKETGAWGKFAALLFPHFTLQRELYLTLANKLESGDPDQHRYLFRHFLTLLRTLFKSTYIKEKAQSVISKMLLENDKVVTEAYDHVMWDFQDEWIMNIENLRKQHNSNT